MNNVPAKHPSIAICIITYKRPQMLARALDGLQNINLPPQTKVALHVIDNDPTASAEAVVTSRQKGFPLPVFYWQEPEKGIPHARNKALTVAAASDYIAFVDDDDVADADWLLNSYDALRRYNADVVQGKMVYRFPQNKLHWEQLDIFAPPIAVTGAEIDSAWTCNVLFSTKLIASGLRFDPRFHSTGGSDYHFFRACKQRGARIVMCHEAVVYSQIEANRARWQWLARRHMRTGATMTISQLRSMGWRHAFMGVLHATNDSGRYAGRLFRGVMKGENTGLHPLMVVCFLAGRIAGLALISPKEYRKA